MHVYKKNNDIKDEDSKDTEEKVKLKYLTVSAEIVSLWGLLEADRSKRQSIINDNLSQEMLQISSHYKTDPVLLASLCRYAKQLFSREELKNNQHLLEPRSRRCRILCSSILF